MLPIAFIRNENKQKIWLSKYIMNINELVESYTLKNTIP